MSPCAKNSGPQAMTRSFSNDFQKGELVQKAAYYHDRMMRPEKENNHEFSLKYGA